MSGMVDAVFGGPPDAPDPYATAAAQTGMNRDAILASAEVNQMNQVGPGFNISYSGEIGQPNRTMRYSLSPERQALANQLNQNALSSSRAMSGAVNANGIPAMPAAFDPNSINIPQNSAPVAGPQAMQTGEFNTSAQPVGQFGSNAGTASGMTTGDYSTTINNATDQAYSALQNRLKRTQGNEYDRTVNELTQRGLPIGQEAWNDTMTNLSANQADENLQAATAAQKLGIDMQANAFNQDATKTQVGNQAVGQNFGQDLSGYNANLTGNNQQFSQDIAKQSADLATNAQNFGQNMQGAEFETNQGINQFNQSTQRAQLAAALQGQGYEQGANNRGAGISDIAAIDQINAQRAQLASALNPENQVSMPNQPAYQQAPADIAGLISNNYGQQMGAYNAALGGLSNLGGAGVLAAFSHPSFKEDHQEISSILPRIDMLKVKAWKYRKGIADGGALGYHIGPYADQFKELFGIGDGVTINLADAMGILFAGLKELNEKFNESTLGAYA